MSQGLGNSGGSRDYGTNGPPVPAVGFADFSPTEMYNLSENIAANITSINSGWRSLDKTLKLIGTIKDNQTLRDSARETQQTVNSSVAATTRDLRRLTVVVRRGDKRQKLQVERLTQTFSDAVTKYSSIQKQLSAKMQMHMPKMAMSDFTSEGGEEDDDTARLVAQKQVQVRAEEFESGLLADRETYILQIEADVLDVNQIMRELGAIVHAQATVVDAIENNIEGGASNVETGVEELVKASGYVNKVRRKTLILLAIGVIVVIILIVIIVNSVKR